MDLARYRIETARDCLETSEMIIDGGKYKGAVNRSYYCIFNAMRAVLALDGVDFKKHSAVISAFRERYIKTGKLREELSDMIKISFEVRGKSDYDDFYIISKEETAQQISNAKIFLEAVEKYLGEQ
jgi:uncharacterized protein (UPF0332 family)